MKLAACVATHGDGLEFTDDFAMHDASHPTDFRQVYARAFDLHPLRILDRLAAVFGLETRVSAALLEEILVCPRQVLYGLLQHLTVRLAEPFELLLKFRKPNRHGMIVQAFAGCAVEISRFYQSVVPDPPCAPELNRQDLLLFIGRIKTNSGHVKHELYYTLLYLRKQVPYVLGSHIPIRLIEGNAPIAGQNKITSVPS